MRGKEEELGSFVFGYGHVAQAEMYNKTIEEVADYVGKKFSKEMRLVIKKKKEFAPTKPTHQTTNLDKDTERRNHGIRVPQQSPHVIGVRECRQYGQF